ncbi:hypothetical protein ACFL7M_18130 [Thermodesulfobacteriota bacterium]
MNDKRLRAHLEKSCSLLKPFDPVVKRLSTLNSDRVLDVIGICEEDIDGNRSWLTLKGSIHEKI